PKADSQRGQSEKLANESANEQPLAARHIQGIFDPRLVLAHACEVDRALSDIPCVAGTRRIALEGYRVPGAANDAKRPEMREVALGQNRCRARYEVLRLPFDFRRSLDRK